MQSPLYLLRGRDLGTCCLVREPGPIDSVVLGRLNRCGIDLMRSLVIL